MAGSLCIEQGTISGSCKSFTLVPVPGQEVPKLKTTSRGGFPNSGKGPYFVAVKSPTKVVDGSTTYKMGLSLYGRQGGMTYATYRCTDDDIAVLMATCYYYSGGPYVLGQAFYNQFLSWDYRPNGEVYANCRKAGGNVGRNYYRNIDPNNIEAWYAEAMRLLQIGRFSWTYYSYKVRDTRGQWVGAKEYGFKLDGDFDFKLKEFDTFSWAVEFGILSNGTASRWATAFANAVSALDLSSVNSMANVIQLASGAVGLAKLVRRIFKGEFGKISKDIISAAQPGNAWLSYRYVLKTTESDIKEYRETLQRLGSLANIGQYLHSTGRYSDETGSYKVEVVVNVYDVIPKDTVEFLAAIGLEPTATNLWDMIPYSFIVDWFLHIGNLLEWVETVGDCITLPYQECWFTYMSEYDSQHVFYRVSGRRPDIPPIYATREASGKTIRMRVADTLSLFWR